MSTEQTAEPTSTSHLASHTRWSREAWESARRYHSDFEDLLPRIVAIDGPPKLVAEALRQADRESGLPRTSPGAKRYADALARAAVADARVDALVEMLAEQAYFRQQAESEMLAIESRVDLGGHQIIYGSGEVPPNAVHGLLDLTDGRCWVFDGIGNEDESWWIRVDSDPRNQTRYAWPIPDAGPFIALMDNWHLSRLNDAARAWDETTNTLHRMLDRLDGYRAEGDSSYAKPPLAEALGRVLRAKDQKASDQLVKTHEVEAKVRAAERRLGEMAQAWDEGAEATAEWMANNPGPTGVPHDPPSNPYETGGGDGS